MRTLPSSLITNAILSPVSMPRYWRISIGIVTRPLLLTVDSISFTVVPHMCNILSGKENDTSSLHSSIPFMQQILYSPQFQNQQRQHNADQRPRYYLQDGMTPKHNTRPAYQDQQDEAGEHAGWMMCRKEMVRLIRSLRRRLAGQ